MQNWGRNNMTHVSRHKPRTILVILIAFLLQGCGIQPLCPPTKNAEPTKISNDPTIAPYKVVGTSVARPSIAEVKNMLKNQREIKIIFILFILSFNVCTEYLT